MDYTDLLIQIKEECAKLREEHAKLREEHASLQGQFERLQRAMPRIDQGVFEKIDGWQRGAWGLGTGSGGGQRFHHVPICFNRAFTQVPSVCLSFYYVDTGSCDVRICVEAKEVTTAGFVLQIRTWEDSKVYGLKVRWIAVSTQP
jgi:hypothetical protein